MTVIHGYADAKDPALQIRMHFPRGPSGSPVTLIGPMPEQFNYSISAQWEALAGRGEMPDGMLGRAATAGIGASSINDLSLAMSALVWSGNEHLEIQLPFHIHGDSDPTQEITEVVKILSCGAVPILYEGGVLEPPGIKPYEALGTAASGTIPAFGITLEIGKFVRLPQLVITSITPTFDLHMWKSGDKSAPMEATIDIGFRTYFALNDKYIRHMFGETISAERPNNPVTSALGAVQTLQASAVQSMAAAGQRVLTGQGAQNATQWLNERAEQLRNWGTKDLLGQIGFGESDAAEGKGH